MHKDANNITFTSFQFTKDCSGLLNDHLPEKRLFNRFPAHVFRKLLSIYVFSSFPFGFEGMIWDLIVSVPDHFYFAYKNDES